MTSSSEFRLVQEVEIDDQGRAALGQAIRAGRYRILVNSVGQILLDPVADQAERERWLWENPTVLSSVQQGLEQAAQGETISLGSFAQYAELEIED